MNLTFNRCPNPSGSCLYISPFFSTISAIPIIDKKPFDPFGDPSALIAIRSPTFKFKKCFKALYDLLSSPCAFSRTCISISSTDDLR